jgi:hypothetical protein
VLGGVGGSVPRAALRRVLRLGWRVVDAAMSLNLGFIDRQRCVSGGASQTLVWGASWDRQCPFQLAGRVRYFHGGDDGGDGGRVVDDRDDPHRCSTVRASEHLDFKAAPQEVGPLHPRRALRRDGATCLFGVGWLWHDPPALGVG